MEKRFIDYRLDEPGWFIWDRNDEQGNLETWTPDTAKAFWTFFLLQFRRGTSEMGIVRMTRKVFIFGENKRFPFRPSVTKKTLLKKTCNSRRSAV